MLALFAGVIEPDVDEPPQVEFTDKHRPTKAWLLQFQPEHLADDAEDWRVRRHLEAYLLWLFGCAMFTSSHHDSVNKQLIWYAQQIADALEDGVPQCSWGSALLGAMQRTLCDACTRRPVGWLSIVAYAVVVREIRHRTTIA